MLNTNSLIASILVRHSNNLNFYSPSYLLDELSEHQEKLAKIIKIADDEYNELLKLVTRNISFVMEEEISHLTGLKLKGLLSQ